MILTVEMTKMVADALRGDDERLCDLGTFEVKVVRADTIEITAAEWSANPHQPAKPRVFTLKIV